MVPRERVLAVLRGEQTDKVPFTVYECMIPQCAVERRLRDEALCIVNRRYRLSKLHCPNCPSDTLQQGSGRRLRNRLIRTRRGDLTSVAQPADFTSWAFERFFKGPEDYAAALPDRGRRSAGLCALPGGRALDGRRRDPARRGRRHPLHPIMLHWMGIETFAEEWAERRDEVLKLEAAWREAGAGLPDHRRRADHPRELRRQRGAGSHGQGALPGFCCRSSRMRRGLPREGQAARHPPGREQPAWAKDLVARPGLDYIEAFTPAPDTDMTLAEALSRLAGQGALDQLPLLAAPGDVEPIRQTARERSRPRAAQTGPSSSASPRTCPPTAGSRTCWPSLRSSTKWRDKGKSHQRHSSPEAMAEPTGGRRGAHLL